MVKQPQIRDSSSFKSFLFNSAPFECVSDSNFYSNLVGGLNIFSGLNLNTMKAYIQKDDPTINVEDLALDKDISQSLPKYVKQLKTLHSQITESID